MKFGLQNSYLKLLFVALLLFIAEGRLEALPEADSDLIVREQMLQISKELGVTCTFCHNSENFKDAKNKNYNIARDHFRVLRMLNSEQGLNDKPKVSCYVCHQGKAKFTFALKSKSEK